MNHENGKIKVVINGDIEIFCYPQTIVKNIIKKNSSINIDNCLGALVNNEIVTLNYPLEVDSTLSLLDNTDSHGWRIYRNSLSYLLSKASQACFPESKLEIKHSLGNAFFCSFEEKIHPDNIDNMLLKIKLHMQKLVSDKLPITRRKLYFADAINYFTNKNRKDKCDLLRFQNPSKVPVYQCEDFLDLAQYVLVENTKMLTHFDLLPYETGFVLQFPEREYPMHIDELKTQKCLFNIFKTYKEWGETIGLKTVGKLNEIIVRGNYQELVEIEEAFQEKKIAEIADTININKDHMKWILIAGPSSSGKTTFAHRLGTQLQVNGMTPVIISVDNYFVDRTETPRTENGDYDFEHIETIDLPLFHEHLLLLDEGKTVEKPIFDFKLGKREWSGEKMQLKENEIAIIEGIHSLNPRMTESLPPEHKFKIYINALTQLNLDDNHRISTTDNRLLRRIIRDHRTRGNRALATLQMWQNVRKGEKKWIFPFQHHADVAFSSALNYELAVLKPFAEPLLAEVKPWHPQYAAARRLQNFLENFSHASIAHIPHKSLIREFIGGGIIT